jgi:23S rRNA-/tRNA-specific pseudouridylate synthase
MSTQATVPTKPARGGSVHGGDKTKQALTRKADLYVDDKRLSPVHRLDARR